MVNVNCETKNQYVMSNKINVVIVRNEFNDYSIKELPEGFRNSDFQNLSFKGLIHALGSIILSEFEEPIF